ncbi:MAG TPA: VWA domain-containing protein [Paraburkholderia sp.]|jgi:uncharacterized protein (DUF58 family)|nr:VWA domain-containing protein [Paraburkholderia sp.]
MPQLKEFHYRMPARVAGIRPGSHPGTSVGAGQEFVSHTRLFDSPDPRRIDIAASIRGGYGEWLVRLYRQRVAVPVYALVDVSASMRFGGAVSKLEAAAQFAEALGYSAFRHGDPVGMLAFDALERADLFVPPRHGRAAGTLMGEALRRARPAAQPGAPLPAALEKAFARLAGRACMVFVVSDFHWPVDTLLQLLRGMPRVWLVPIVVWSAAEVEPPAADGWLTVHDLETGKPGSLWMTDALRRRWRARVAAARQHLVGAFAQRGVQPLFVVDHFDADALTRYFVEQMA